MATEPLFGNRITPACKYCRESLPAADGVSFMCPRGGIVPAEYSCRRFYYDPLRRVPKPPVILEKFDGADFSLDTTDT